MASRRNPNIQNRTTTEEHFGVVPTKMKADGTAPGGARDSAYTTFDSYFSERQDRPASGVGDIGRGLMNPVSDDDSDSDDEDRRRRPAQASPGKQRALYEAATAGSTRPPAAEASPDSHLRVAKQPQAVATARSNDWLASQHVESSSQPIPAGRQQQSAIPASMQAGRPPFMQARHPPAMQAGGPPAMQAGGPPAMQAGRFPTPTMSPHPQPPQAAFMPPMQAPRPGLPPGLPSNPYFANAVIPGSPAPSARTPHPLSPPTAPITPVFARPRREDTSVSFDEKSILRGNSEETLLARTGRGGKGDDFWRRFSMVARDEASSGHKKSAWLKKTQSGSTRFHAWVWVLGLLLLALIGGGIGLGWYLTHNKAAAPPVAIGGSAGEKGTTSSQSGASTIITATKVTPAPVPTNERRAIRDVLLTSVPEPTPVDLLGNSTGASRRHHRQRDHNGALATGL